jgi:Ca2+-binding EF-hand superfamily protein
MIRTTTVIATMLIAVFMIVGSAIAQQKPLDVIFENMDVDKNGFVSEEEWHNAMQKRFEAMDKNRNRNLSREEVEESKETMRERFRSRMRRKP